MHLLLHLVSVVSLLFFSHCGYGIVESDEVTISVFEVLFERRVRPLSSRSCFDSIISVKFG